MLTTVRQFVVDALLLPPGGVVVLMVAGLLLWRRRPRIAALVLGAAVALLYAVSTPFVAVLLTRATGDYAPFENPGNARAIVILAAERAWAPEYGGVRVGDLTLDRLRLGAQLARATGLPVLVSGGRFDRDDADSMAAMMARTLREEFGVPVRWLEEDSRDTRENADRSAAILRAAGIETAVLVTHYAHMRRAQDDFAAAGIATVPAPVAMPAPWARLGAADFKPNPHALAQSAFALHELLARAAAPLRR